MGQDVPAPLGYFFSLFKPEKLVMQPLVWVANFLVRILRHSFVSVFSRKSKKEYAGGLNQLENSDVVWRMLRRAHKQMARYGGTTYWRIQT